MENIHHKNLSAYHFHWADYLAFVFMILFSAGCGVYYGFIHPKQTRKKLASNHSIIASNFGSVKMNEYLLGSSELKVFPVAMSLVASYISGVTVLGTPSEVYNHGTQYWLVVVAICFMGVVVAKVYMPVFFTLKIGSSYEV